VALVAFASILVALGVMLVWSLIATIVFCCARERGYPNMLTAEEWRPNARATARFAALSVCKAWLAGFQAFAYARMVNALLIPGRRGLTARLARYGVLAVGMTLFGVTMTEHLLRCAGYSGARLVWYGLLGPFLNVPYRVLLSAMFVHATMSLLAAISPGTGFLG
jgi:hypothetical protein